MHRIVIVRMTLKSLKIVDFIGFWRVMDEVVRWVPKWFKGGKSGRKCV